MTSRPERGRTEPPTKVIVLAGQFPWTGVAYTTRDGARRPYGDQAELLCTIAELAGWPDEQTVQERLST